MFVAAERQAMQQTCVRQVNMKQKHILTIASPDYAVNVFNSIPEISKQRFSLAHEEEEQTLHST